MHPISINYHLYKPCNLHCRFCFATFRDVHSQLPLAEARALIKALKQAGGEKLTFVGGEPTLHPHIGELVALAADIGFVVCIVTNGARLDALLDTHHEHIHWVGLSIDSGSEQVQQELGRGAGDHIRRSLALARRCHCLGIQLKLNTVVTRLTWREDMSSLVHQIRPRRWKVFQVLPIGGQNDGSVEPLVISPDQFNAFVVRHRLSIRDCIPLIVESNDAMRGSYVMVDPAGRFYGNATGRQVYSEPILDVGVSAALAQVGFEPQKFEARGGRYSW